MAESIVLRVDMSTLKTTREAPAPDELLLGGRSFIVHRLLKEVPPTCDPLGRHNKLFLLPGILGGTLIPCSGRLSAGGKSPLTGGVKEANGGGTAGHKLARLGIKSLILEGLPQRRDAAYLLLATKDRVELVPCPELKGMGVYETAEKLLARYGKKVGVILIGPAGELQLTAAGITNTDRDGEPSRYCARGGLGAVMGSKSVKAVVLDDDGTTVCPSCDRERLAQLIRELGRLVKETPHTAELLPKYGTDSILPVVHSLGALPTRNFSTGTFEGADKIGPEALRQFIIDRGGAPRHACMPGCPIGCSNVLRRRDGSVLVSPLEYESICMLGSNLGIDDLDAIGELNRACNDVGVDTIDVGGAIGVAMEAGLVKFGDAEGALKLVREIATGSVLGRVIGHGGAVAARVLGVRHVAAVKGQYMPAYEPRGIKGLGVTYATSPMGADHTAGHTVAARVDHHSPEGQVEASRKAQLGSVIIDSVGLCSFIAGAVRGRAGLLADLIWAHLGVDVSDSDLTALAKRTLAAEREFNRRAGFTAVDDRLPEWFQEEVNPASKTVFDVPAQELDRMWEDQQA